MTSCPIQPVSQASSFGKACAATGVIWVKANEHNAFCLLQGFAAMLQSRLLPLFTP
jgi:hypothetical protein